MEIVDYSFVMTNLLEDADGLLFEDYAYFHTIGCTAFVCLLRTPVSGRAMVEGKQMFYCEESILSSAMFHPGHCTCYFVDCFFYCYESSIR